MPTPKSAARTHLDQLLADGEWHDRDTLVAAIAGLIPPGKARRRAVGTRERGRRDHVAVSDRGPQGGPGPGDDTRVGARDIARRTINGLVTNGVAEKRTHHGAVQIRLRPKATR